MRALIFLHKGVHITKLKILPISRQKATLLFLPSDFSKQFDFSNKRFNFTFVQELRSFCMLTSVLQKVTTERLICEGDKDKRFKSTFILSWHFSFRVDYEEKKRIEIQEN